jgi:hypothetical protein
MRRILYGDKESATSMTTKLQWLLIDRAASGLYFHDTGHTLSYHIGMDARAMPKPNDEGA